MVFTKRYRKERIFSLSVIAYQVPGDMLICLRMVVITGVGVGRFVPKKTLMMLGDILVVTPGVRGVTGTYWVKVKAEDVTKHSIMHRMGTHNKRLSGLKCQQCQI